MLIAAAAELKLPQGAALSQLTSNIECIRELCSAEISL